MIRRIVLRNYKAFAEFTVELGPRALLIGPNNAGKTTLISALKLAAYLTRPGQLRGFEVLISGDHGVRFDLEDAGINPVSLTHNNAGGVAEIFVTFDDELELRLAMHPGGSSEAAWYAEGDPVYQARVVKERLRGTVGVVPAVGPLDLAEEVLSEQHVRRNIDGPLAPLHFRNQWRYGLFPDFSLVSNAVSATLPGIRIYPPNLETGPGKPVLTMDYREGKFAAELAEAGHGIQVWVQLISHLTRLSGRRSLVLDEPDVYLHPDLQRRVAHVIDALDVEQFIVATHSVDILNEFALEDVIQIDKRNKKARALAGLAELRRVTDSIGSVANAYFARLARERVTLFVEGADFELMRRLADVAGVPQFAKTLQFGFFPIEGSSNWVQLLPFDETLKNFTGERIAAFVALDRDYRCDEQVAEITAKLRGKGVRCHFWHRKEIENYLLVPAAISRAITGPQTLSPDEVQMLIKGCADRQREDVTSQRVFEAEQFLKSDKEHPTTIGKRVMQEINQTWERDWVKLCPGKAVLAEMRQEMERIGVKPPNNGRIVASMIPEDVEPELTEFFQAVVNEARKGRADASINLK